MDVSASVYRDQEKAGSSGAGVTSGCEPAEMGVWEPNSAPLQMLLPPEPSLQQQTLP